jgi:hypothetical protein
VPLRPTVAAFLVALAVYAAVAGPRLRAQSSDPHFVVQAHAWLQGRLDLDRWPPGADDMAAVEHVLLDDGRAVRGRRLTTRDAFHVAGDGETAVSHVSRSVGADYQVPFPPFPAVLFLPLVVMFGPALSDVLATVVLAALVPVLLLAVMRRLRERGLMARAPRDDLWFAALLSFGTVLFFSAVQGRVWYTAHVVAVDLCLAYVWASIDGEHPWLAGTCVGVGFLTRAPLLFMLPLFMEEMWRAGRVTGWRRWFAFALPIAVAIALAGWHNYARFGEVSEFGYRYLRVRQQYDIERHGLFNLRYLGRNAVAAFALLPEVTAAPPFARVSGHGLAIWVTTPALLLLLAAPPRRAFQYGLWMTAAAVAIWTLLYQNTGWLQFGYRFSLDYVAFLVLLLAVNGRPLSRLSRALIVLSMAINLFGAVTFDRYPQFYRADSAAYEALVHD